MKSVLIRNDKDLLKLDTSVDEVEFYKYEGLFDYSKLSVGLLSFTKMDVDLEDIYPHIEELALFDCEFNMEDLKRFISLKCLKITNKKFDILDILDLQNIESLNLNFCDISNIKYLCKFDNLKEISLIETNIEDFDFLFNLEHLETVSIDKNAYLANKRLFETLCEKGVVITDMMGGVYDEI